ncbi:glycoside hydrolase family 3 protein [Meredithblackwellia eburnea MCA 4105]
MKVLDVEEVLSRLTLLEKVKLLAGKDLWHFESAPSQEVPSLRVSDGPNGVRGTKLFKGVPASCFPCATGIAASFDLDLVRKIGIGLALECRAKSVHCLLGPTANFQRSPLGGRGFESFSEDPVLSGFVASAYIEGVQSLGVSACMKHFVANDQEHERYSMNSVISTRALRELYLKPFQLALKISPPHSIMTSYNMLNGVHCSESQWLLDTVLRKEWGFQGLIMSDWTGTYSTSQALKAGLDVEMPGPTVMRGEAVVRQIAAGKLTVEVLDHRVRAMLNFTNRAILSRIPFDGPEASIDTPNQRALLREAAASAIVLLKNDGNLLPLRSSSNINSIAIIGSNAKVPVPSGGGSAALTSTYTISALQGITKAAKSHGLEVEFSVGVSAFRVLPLIDPFMSDATVEVFATSPFRDWHYNQKSSIPAPSWKTRTISSNCFLLNDFTTTFTPDQTGIWELSIASVGGSTMFLDGVLLLDNVAGFLPGELFFGMGSQELRAKVQLVGGKQYSIELRQSMDLVDPAHPAPFTVPTWRIGAFPLTDPSSARAEAVALAEKCDVAIVMVGTNPDWEGEAFDRKTIKIPGLSDELVEAVLSANKNTVVVTQSGTPVAMPWIDSASTVLHAFFGGNELGTGLADVLFGKVNPSGKLPVTFPKRLEDNPAFHSFGIDTPTPGQVVYGEDIFVGYRHYERANIAPLFAFGHGLSYTTFEFSDLRISLVSQLGEFSVTFKVKNTGLLDGSIAPQVYVAAPKEGRPPSPSQELKGFIKVSLKVGETKEVQLEMDKEAFSHWDDKRDSWVAGAGLYEVRVSEASDKVKLVGEAVLSTTIMWRGLM